MPLDNRILENSPPNRSKHDFLYYLHPAISHPDANLDLKFLIENKMGTLTGY
jgi:hypothetical protein